MGRPKKHVEAGELTLPGPVLYEVVWGGVTWNGGAHMRGGRLLLTPADAERLLALGAISEVPHGDDSGTGTGAPDNDG